MILGALGVSLLGQLLVERVLRWIRDHAPSIPWPDVDRPSVPWSDVDWPDVTPPARTAEVPGETSPDAHR